jgi:hypothetical protein
MDAQSLNAINQFVAGGTIIFGGDLFVYTAANGVANHRASLSIGSLASLNNDSTGDILANTIETAGDAIINGTLTADHIHGNLAGSVYAHVRAGETLAKGDPVYISGSHGSGESLIPIVSKADASNAAKMPAVGIMDAALANNANGHMVITGTITELNTNAYAVNSVLYVATGGGFTSTPPAANSQAVAIVERSNTNNGAVIVKVNGLASSGGNGASDANKLVRFSSTGGASLTGGTLTDMTYAGSAAFTSTTRPTSAGTGTPGATSLITLTDAESLNLFANSYIKEMNRPEGSSSSATSGSGSAGLFGAAMVRVVGSTIASAWQRYHFGDYSMGPAPYFVGGGFPASRVFAVAFNAIITIPANDRSCFYAGYLGGFSDALPAPSAAALSSLGFCMRLYYSATNSRYEITLHAHNGTTLTNSSPVAAPIAVNNSNTQSYIISTNGSGTVRLYSAAASVGPIGTTPLISITGGPSSGSYPPPFTFGIANGATPPASSAAALITTSPKVHIGATY